MADRTAYKILTAAEFAAFRQEGVFRGSAADLADGFVHLSGAAQVEGTLERHFQGQADLVIAAIDLDRCGDGVRWEVSRGGALFPHLYGALPIGAVTAAGPVERGADGALLLPVAMEGPRGELVYVATVEIGEALDLGMSPLGQRRMIPITGGVFEGPAISGTVLPGGADRQLWRRDGVRLLEAIYEMRAANGDVIGVRNEVLIDPGPPRYAFSHVRLVAPEGPNGWLNRFVYVGTLESLAPRKAVRIGVFRLV